MDLSKTEEKQKGVEIFTNTWQAWFYFIFSNALKPALITAK